MCVYIYREREKYVALWHDFWKKYSAMPPLVKINFLKIRKIIIRARFEREKYLYIMY